MGFREGRGTIDAVYMVKNEVQNVIENGGKVYTLFVDLKAA